MRLKDDNAIVSMLAQNFHIVLVEPQESLNIGSVARAMSNMGFSNLHLVAPLDYLIDRARITACHGGAVLDSLTIHEDLESCLASMKVVVGFSGQHGKHRPAHVMLSEWKHAWMESPSDKTALVFGPEATGLRTDHLAHLRWTVRIPSSEENASLNLAQAVLVVLYELQRNPELVQPVVRERAEASAHYHLDRIVTEVLDGCEFYREGTPGPIPDLVKNLLRRIEPDSREMGVLLAMFARINSAMKKPA